MNRFKRLCLPSVLLLIVFFTPETSTRGQRAIRPVAIIEGFDLEASTGLFIGVGDFIDKSIRPVAYAVDDAVDLAHRFAYDLNLILPERVVLALSGDPAKPSSIRDLNELLKDGARKVEATRFEILRHLKIQSGNAGNKGMFLLTIATHGFSKDGDNYFLPRDAIRSMPGMNDLAVEQLLALASEARTQRVIVLVDTCREHSIAEGRSVRRGPSATGDFIRALGSASGLAVLFATTEGGFSYSDEAAKNGVFTRAVLEGLEGKAGADERGYITIGTLAAYVHLQVQEWVARHRPDDLPYSRGIHRYADDEALKIPLAVDSDPDTGEPADLPGPLPPPPRRADVVTELREPEVVLVPGGRFQMGTPPGRIEHLLAAYPAWRAEWFSDEIYRDIHLPSFRIGKYEVTNGEFATYLIQTGRREVAENLGPPNLPVVEVNFDEARSYCRWLTDVTGRNYRLPTEAEWEKAARGNGGLEYPWGNGNPTSDLAVFLAPGPEPVGSRPSGQYGTYDMAGNVSEWCLFQSGEASAEPPGREIAPVRGGSFRLRAFYLRAAARREYRRSEKRPDVGFRVALVEENR